MKNPLDYMVSLGKKPLPEVETLQALRVLPSVFDPRRVYVVAEHVKALYEFQSNMRDLVAYVGRLTLEMVPADDGQAFYCDLCLDGDKLPARLVDVVLS